MQVGFPVKTDADGKPVRYKARLVAKGFMQRKHIDYEETFAPVAKLTTIRTILAVANTRDLEIHQMDVRTAFLNGKLTETVYMEVPEGVKSKPDEICLLERSLYGLKQSPRCWNRGGGMSQYLPPQHQFNMASNVLVLIILGGTKHMFLWIGYINDTSLMRKTFNKMMN